MNWSEIPVVAEYDVVVVGGGMAGFAAAIGAARGGAKTLIVEENAYLGGTGTGAAIGLLSGFADDDTESNISGVLRDMLCMLWERGAASGIETIYLCNDSTLGVKSLRYDPLALKCVLDEMVMQAGVDTLFHTRAIAAEVTKKQIQSVVIHNTAGIQRIKAKCYVDASFHAALAADAGVAWVIGNEREEMQPATLIFYSNYVDMQSFNSLTREERMQIANKGISSGKLYVDNLISRKTPNGLVQSNMGRVIVNPLHPFEYSLAEMTGRKQAREISDYFKEKVPGFGSATLVATGDYLGLRESRRIVGKYVLTGKDIMSGTAFEDGIAYSSYPIDIHEAAGNSSVLKKPCCEKYSIPFRSLITDQIDNLIMAGRCISADYEAHSALRVMVTCLRIGEAAGMAAAVSVTDNIAANQIDGKQFAMQMQCGTVESAAC